MLSAVVLACYLASAAWLGSSVYRACEGAAHGRRIAGLALGVVALAMHGALLQKTLFARPSLSFGVTETASLIAWPMGAIAIALAWLRPRFAALAAVIAAAAGIAALAGVEGASGYAIARRDWEVGAHILLSTVAYAVLSIAVVLTIALALLDRRLRRRRPLGWLTILPSVEALEDGAFQALAAGFALLTLALFSGFVFVKDLFAQHLIHKTVLSCLAWLVFAILLFGRWRFGWRGRTATGWTLSGFALLALAYFGSKIVLETILGRHWG
ncbi:MAG TPA: cytochrome c biogenesis protein CcsA [Steroidobacter sp.]|nr:cytochrome c biogenesis protein CcsA [Steroidobacter sp.]